MKKKNRILTLVMVMALGMSLTACGSSSKSYDGAMTESMNSAEGNSGNDLYYDDEYYEESKMETSSESVATNRKLIKTVNLTAETYEFDKLVSAIEAKVNLLGGYMESSSIHTRYDNLQYGDFVIRIPERNMDKFVTEVAEISNITGRDSSQKDVTLSYVDLESHKKALRAEEESLLRLLESAQSIDDIITLQSRLSDIRYEIESIESQLRTMDNLVDYATVYLDVEEVETYTPVEEPTMGERIRTGFNNSLKDIGNGFKNLFVFLIINSPFLLIWAVIIVVAVFVIRWIIKLAMKKGEESARKREIQMRMTQIPLQNLQPGVSPNMKPNPQTNMQPNMQQNIPQNELQNGRNNGQ